MKMQPAARMIIGYDGSLPANAAIDAVATLLPNAYAWIAHLWTPPFASEALRRRLWHGTAAVNEFMEAVEREGEAEAYRIVAMGVTLARAAGLDADALVQRSYAGDGLLFTQLAEKLQPDLAVLGSRGLGGARAVLGSVSDIVVHYAPRPALVVPYPLLTAEHAALAGGPVVVGWDGSAGARAAHATARALLPGRPVILVAVDEPAPAPDDADEIVHVERDRLHGGPARDVANTLARVARDRDAALLVVGSRGRTAVQEILLGSVAMATLHRAYRPVLVVPQRRAAAH